MIFRPQKWRNPCIKLFIFASLSSICTESFATSVRGQLVIPDSVRAPRVAVEKYTGKISGKVLPEPQPIAGVWLTARSLSAPASSSPVTLAQSGYQFASNLIVIATGTTVFFPNKDIDYHNVYSLSRPHRFDLGRYKKDETPIPSRRFDKSGVINLRCEIHEHMRATIVVVDSPYFTTTDAAGNFQLTGVAPGDYTLHGYLEKGLTWQQKVTITGSQMNLGALEAK